MPEDKMYIWNVYQGKKNIVPDPERIEKLPPAPPWRRFDHSIEERESQQTTIFIPDAAEIEAINTSLCLRRPLLITGDPGTGKSSLAYAVAKELGLGPVLYWPITSRSTLQEGLYRYDAIGRIHETNIKNDPANQQADISIERFLQLGPLGTAFLPGNKPRVLLIDEIDKSDVDLPNDLLHIFERGEFEIPELVREAEKGLDNVPIRLHESDQRQKISGGRVRCNIFPFVVLTSNGERSFPSAFLRRCIRLDIQRHMEARLVEIVAAHFGLELEDTKNQYLEMIDAFIQKRDGGMSVQLATDQLLNAIYLTRVNVGLSKEELINIVLRPLDS